jgi:demethylmenaquinone methyltransferase/2-methoxy-6-polyprenyl-1,4-benzoquinol methylase
MDTEAYLKHLIAISPVRASTIRAAIAALELPSGSRGLDAGCGIGLQCLQLLEAVGAEGHVTGIDVTSEFLECGRELVKEAGHSKQISLQEGDIASLPFDDNSFDWVWSSDCVGYGPWEPLPLLQELGRVVKPGGIVAIAAWSSEKLLPGYPLLEARLSATLVGLAPFVPGKNPNKHFLRALGWFRELGFEELRADVFSKSFCSPANDEMRDALTYLFQSRWHQVESELNREDQTQFQRLCDPQSPDFILDHPDYYGFFTYSMFWGKATNHGI